MGVLGTAISYTMINNLKELEIGQRVDNATLFGLFPQIEGQLGMIYGRIRSGKTTHGVHLIYEALKQGRTVYSNIPINLDYADLDQRNSLTHLFWSLVYPLKKTFYKFHKENFHYVDVDQYYKTSDLIEHLTSLTDCLIVWDEGWYLFDSYEGTSFSKGKRALILHTGHYNREILILSQRPSSIQVSARGNINIFYKCIKKMAFPFLILQIDTLEDMKDEMPDENAVSHTKVYFPSKKLHKLFDTHFLRKGIPSSQEIQYEAYKLTYGNKILQLYKLTLKKFFESLRLKAKGFKKGTRKAEKKEIHAEGRKHKPLAEILPF